MPLHELVLRLADRAEARFADRDGYHLGDRIDVVRRRDIVVGTEPPQWPNGSKRFVLEPIERARLRGLVERLVRFARLFR
jgi:hypothetical protein